MQAAVVGPAAHCSRRSCRDPGRWLRAAAVCCLLLGVPSWWPLDAVASLLWVSPCSPPRARESPRSSEPLQPQPRSSGDAAARRRDVLGIVPVLLSASLQAPAGALVASSQFEDKVKEKGGSIRDFKKTESGLRYLELLPGKGETCCSDGDGVTVEWSMRRSNGYFIDASRGFDESRGIDDRFSVGESPDLRFKPLAADAGVIEGIREAVVGMRVGGTRRIIVPASLGYVSDALQPQLQDWGRKRQLESHRKEPLVFELKLRTLRPQDQ